MITSDDACNEEQSRLDNVTHSPSPPTPARWHRSVRGRCQINCHVCYPISPHSSFSLQSLSKRHERLMPQTTRAFLPIHNFCLPFSSLSTILHAQKASAATESHPESNSNIARRNCFRIFKKAIGQKGRKTTATTFSRAAITPPSLHD